MKTMKNILHYLVLPITLFWRALIWPSKFFRKTQVKSEIEKIAEIIPEGIPCHYDPPPSVGSRYSFRQCLEYSKYKEHNPDTLVQIRSWSFDPIVYSRDDKYSRKVLNRWRWRLGLYTPGEAEDKKSN